MFRRKDSLGSASLQNANDHLQSVTCCRSCIKGSVNGRRIAQHVQLTIVCQDEDLKSASNKGLIGCQCIPAGAPRSILSHHDSEFACHQTCINKQKCDIAPEGLRHCFAVLVCIQPDLYAFAVLEKLQVHRQTNVTNRCRTHTEKLLYISKFSFPSA